MTKLLVLAAERSEDLSPPIDGHFLRQHNVTADECGQLSQLAAVALAGFAGLETIDRDVYDQVVFVGTATLAGLPNAAIDHGLNGLKMKQLTRKLGE